MLIDCIPGAIWFVNGTDKFSGRVEVCISGHPGFGTVCDDHWDAFDVQIVCRQLGPLSVACAPTFPAMGEPTRGGGVVHSRR